MAGTNFLDGFQSQISQRLNQSKNLPQTNTAIENPCRWSISSKDADFAAKWRYQILGLAGELSIPYHIRKAVFLWLLFQTTISYWCMTSIELTHFFPAFLVERGRSHPLRMAFRVTVRPPLDLRFLQWSSLVEGRAGEGSWEWSCWNPGKLLEVSQPKPRHISWCFR